MLRTVAGMLMITLALAAGCAIQRPDSQQKMSQVLSADKGKHIVKIMEDADKVDTKAGVKYYLAFDSQTQDGDEFRYRFVMFYRCSCGTTDTADLIFITDRQGYIQDYEFEPIYCPLAGAPQSEKDK